MTLYDVDLTKFNQNHGSDGKFTGSTGVAVSPKLAGRLREPDGGFTVDVHTGKERTKGYALSIHPEASESIKGAQGMTDSQLQSAVSGYIGRHSDLLSVAGNYVGGWNDPTDGTVFMDVSHVVGNRALAEKLSLAHDQRAYFDMSKGESVEVNAKATSGGVVKFNHNHGVDGKFGSGAGAGEQDMKFSVDQSGHVETDDTAPGASKAQSMRTLSADDVKSDSAIAQDALESSINTSGLKDTTIVRGHNPDASVAAWYNPNKPGELAYNDAAGSVELAGGKTLDAGVAFSMSHEYGHLLDFEVLNQGSGADSFPGSYMFMEAGDLKSQMNAAGIHAKIDPAKFAAMNKLGHAINDSPSMEELDYRHSIGQLNDSAYTYYRTPSEAFARAFSQYVAVRSGGTIKKQLDDVRNANIIGQWQDKEFEPISNAMDGVLKANGLYKAP